MGRAGGIAPSERNGVGQFDVGIATLGSWHVVHPLAAVWAGKDVYVRSFHVCRTRPLASILPPMSWRGIRPVIGREGRQRWRFREAPVELKILVLGKLCPTLPGPTLWRG